MRRPDLPPALPLVHPLRALDTAVTTFEVLPGHRRRLTIDHQPLAGLTPEDLLWWFRSIGGTTTWGGETVTRYRAWHPLDHVGWQLARPGPHGVAEEGARYHIVEAFQRRPEHLVDSVETVEKLDATGIRLVRRYAGVQVFMLEHTWSRCDGHVHYVSVMDVGARSRALTPLNRHLGRRVLPDEMARAWLQHNVEEVGLLEHLVPHVRAEAAGRAPAPVGAPGPR